MNIDLSQIDSNPHRNMQRNPVQAEQVAALLESFRRNKIWPNVVVRTDPKNDARYRKA